MRKLGKTLGDLTRYRRHWSTLIQNTQVTSRSDAAPTHLTEITGFGSNPGALRMFTYVPKALAPSPALVVVLHGCTQSAASYDRGAGWSTLAERFGFVVLLPEQPLSNNPKRCFNWFLPGDTQRGRGEALSIRQMIDKTIASHGVDRDRVFVTGLSAGGAMAATMLATYPEVFAAGAIIAGLPYGTASNVQQAFESMFHGRAYSPEAWGDLVRGASQHQGRWPRVSIWHGDVDATVRPINAESLIQQWVEVHDVSTTPDEDIVDGYPRKVWRKDGVDVIESYTITGMSHGTPLATGHPDQGCGASGPFLLETGISSSYHIARFFHLTGEIRLRERVEQTAQARKQADRPTLVPSDVEVIPDDRIEVLDDTDDQPFRASKGGPIDVMAVITRALTSAGLMKPAR